MLIESQTCTNTQHSHSLIVTVSPYFSWSLNSSFRVHNKPSLRRFCHCSLHTDTTIMESTADVHVSKIIISLKKKQKTKTEDSSLWFLSHSGTPPTNNDSGVQSHKTCPPPQILCRSERHKVRRPISSEQSCTQNLSLVQWCRIIIWLKVLRSIYLTLAHLLFIPPICIS